MGPPLRRREHRVLAMRIASPDANRGGVSTRNVREIPHSSAGAMRS